MAAIGFDDDSRDAIAKLGLTSLDRADLVKIVALWDPLKQRAAVSSLIYYATHVEKSSALRDRIGSFIFKASAPEDLAQ